jgi:hypothetical protein
MICRQIILTLMNQSQKTLQGLLATFSCGYVAFAGKCNIPAAFLPRLEHFQKPQAFSRGIVMNV